MENSLTYQDDCPQEDLNLFQYLDYRHYLKDYYDQKKQTNTSFSHRVFANKAGLNSPSLMVMIMKGERNLTAKSMPGFFKALGLSNREQKYFETLVSFNQANKPEAKKYYYEQLLPIYKKEHGQQLKADQYEYLSKWHHPVIREMIALPNFRENCTWISRRLKNMISATEAKRTLQLLLELGLVSRNENGRLIQVDVSLATPSVVKNLAALQYHQQMLRLAHHSLTQDPGHKREISGLTASLSVEQYQKLKQYIIEFQNKLVCEFTTPQGSDPQVYQFNFQLFPITEIEKDIPGHA
jgi:uncharacterized protein (TIGR02147 family)